MRGRRLLPDGRTAAGQVVDGLSLAQDPTEKWTTTRILSASSATSSLPDLFLRRTGEIVRSRLVDGRKHLARFRSPTIQRHSARNSSPLAVSLSNREHQHCAAGDWVSLFDVAALHQTRMAARHSYYACRNRSAHANVSFRFYHDHSKSGRIRTRSHSPAVSHRSSKAGRSRNGVAATLDWVRSCAMFFRQRRLFRWNSLSVAWSSASICSNVISGLLSM